MNIATLKKDLRQLKKSIHIIEALKNAQERYLKRIQSLENLVQTDRIKEQIETTKKIMSLMNLDLYIKEASEIEERYMQYINQLEPIDKAIILDNLVNGLPYWKIGMKLGYSEDGIRKRVDKIARQLVTLINKNQ